MLLRISDSYCGTFGLFNRELKQVDLKTKDSDPFELLPDDLALDHIRNGVCVAVGKIPGGALPGPLPESSAKEEPAPAADEPMEEPVEDEDGENIPDLESMTVKELRELAKEYGINAVGMKKAEIVELINNAMGDAPVLKAEDPE